jgi:hypothetical protein
MHLMVGKTAKTDWSSSFTGGDPLSVSRALIDGDAVVNVIDDAATEHDGIAVVALPVGVGIG